MWEPGEALTPVVVQAAVLLPGGRCTRRLELGQAQSQVQRWAGPGPAQGRLWEGQWVPALGPVGWALELCLQALAQERCCERAQERVPVACPRVLACRHTTSAV